VSEIGTQQDYWNSRAANWGNYDAPLILSDAEIGFMSSQLKPGGDALVLGATPQLCTAALEVSSSVTAVDFAEEIIEELKLNGVKYVCKDWNEFFEESSETFDNIMTDGGLLCLEFPSAWQRLAGNILSHLKPGGIFAARIYLSTGSPPQDNYDNPNLSRFVSGMSSIDASYMLQVDTHSDYKSYDVRYAFPPESEVLKTFSHFVLNDKFVPDYEEGERFVSFAWGK
jgi:SAM-dependent methyltransferase